jgi:hypothetical protein
MTPLNTTWQKKGRIYVPPGDGFFKSHATRPIPFVRRDGTVRLFFSSRGADDMPYATFIDLDPDDPAHVLNVHPTPMMPLGRTGTFDDSGVTPVSILRHGGEDRLYYVGWKRRRWGVTIETSIGLALLRRDGDELSRAFEGPILGQDVDHPILTAAQFVVFEDGRYRMWYCSGDEWRQAGGQGEPLYTVHYAESADGIRWTRRAGPVIPYRYDGEVARLRHARGEELRHRLRPLGRRHRLGAPRRPGGHRALGVGLGLGDGLLPGPARAWRPRLYVLLRQRRRTRRHRLRGGGEFPQVVSSVSLERAFGITRPARAGHFEQYHVPNRSDFTADVLAVGRALRAGPAR